MKMRSKAMKYGMLVAVLMLTLSTTLVTVHAYSLRGGRWSDADKRNLTWSMNTRNDWFGECYFYAKQAAYYWNSRCPQIRFVERCRPDSLINLGWFYDTERDEEGNLRYGKSWTRPPSQGTYTEGGILFNTYPMDVEEYYLDRWHKIWTYSHEFGHVLGLADLDTGLRNRLMWYTDFAYRFYHIYYPTTDEQYGIAYLYG